MHCPTVGISSHLCKSSDDSLMRHQSMVLTVYHWESFIFFFAMFFYHNNSFRFSHRPMAYPVSGSWLFSSIRYGLRSMKWALNLVNKWLVIRIMSVPVLYQYILQELTVEGYRICSCVSDFLFPLSGRLSCRVSSSPMNTSIYKASNRASALLHIQ